MLDPDLGTGVRRGRRIWEHGSWQGPGSRGSEDEPGEDGSWVNVLLRKNLLHLTVPTVSFITPNG